MSAGARHASALYRLNSPTVGIRPDEAGRRVVFTMPAGTLISIEAVANEMGLVPINCEGEMVLMFRRDLEDRAERA
jgi:hypothetical protein